MKIKLGDNPLVLFEVLSKIIAYFVCIGLLIASAIIVVTTFQSLFNQDLKHAVQDGLFALILLEMFYVTRSFIRHGSINVSIIVNVGIIAAVKEMIFQLDSLTMQIAIGFGVIFVTLGITYLLEVIYYKQIFKKQLQEEV